MFLETEAEDREKETDSLIALSQTGFTSLRPTGDFLGYSVGRLLSLWGCWKEVHYWLLRSCLARSDFHRARMFLRDWSTVRLPQAPVTKFDPGDHYHAKGLKFDTLGEAKASLKERGFEYGGLRIERISRINRTGD